MNEEDEKRVHDLRLAERVMDRQKRWDQFAAAALTGYLAHAGTLYPPDYVQVTANAFFQADAMMKAWDARLNGEEPKPASNHVLTADREYCTRCEMSWADSLSRTACDDSVQHNSRRRWVTQAFTTIASTRLIAAGWESLPEGTFIITCPENSHPLFVAEELHLPFRQTP